MKVHMKRLHRLTFISERAVLFARKKTCVVCIIFRVKRVNFRTIVEYIALKFVPWLGNQRRKTEGKFTRARVCSFALFTLIKCNHASTFAEYKNVFHHTRNVFIRPARV